MNIGFKEDLLNEFKSDRDKLSDDIIVEAVVAFSNTEGGKLYLGVEDNGEISGLHKAHKNSSGLAALIANRTVPPVSVDVENKQDYIVITVRKSRSIIAASSGKILRRRLKANGEPENAPMYPHEINTRLSTLNMLDYSALAVPDAVYEDLDSNERERLRDIIKKYSGEKNLLELDDEELDKALRLVVNDGDRVVPTYCGLLLIGKAERIQELMPTARAVFQVLSGTDVVFNEDVNGALLSVFERMETYMTARNSEAEIEEGLFRISVFDFDKRAFREALVNAFCHRDYTMLGRVRVEINDDGLVISNPGGFVEGVNINNLLTAEPHGRNPALADVMKRIGLAERTGRGIDRIFEGSLLYGKPMPDYSESTDTLVKLFIPRGLPDKAFAKMISDEQERIGRALPVNSLLILNELKRSSRSTIAELSETIHSSEAKTKSAVEKLVESGMLEAVGTGKGRYYTLSVQVYRRNKTTAEYVRQRGISEVRHPEMIIELAAKNDGKITRADVIELFKIDENRAYRALKDLVSQGKLRPEGKGRYSYYVLIK